MNKSVAYILRESGGMGDIICLDTAGQVLKANGFEKVIVLGMIGFEEVYNHLSSIDGYETIYDGMSERRSRMSLIKKLDIYNTNVGYSKSLLDPNKYPNYIKRIDNLIKDSSIYLLDLYCPAVCYEQWCLSNHYNVNKSRAKIFAEYTGFNIDKVYTPCWKYDTVAVKKAEDTIKQYKLDEKDIVFLGMRGTDGRKNVPNEVIEMIVKCNPKYHFVNLDCYQSCTLREPNYTMLSKLDIATVAELVRKLNQLCISVDTGLLHLFASVDVPTLGVFSATSEVTREWYPKVVPFSIGMPCHPCYYMNKECADKKSACKAFRSKDFVVDISHYIDIVKKNCTNSNMMMSVVKPPEESFELLVNDVKVIG